MMSFSDPTEPAQQRPAPSVHKICSVVRQITRALTSVKSHTGLLGVAVTMLGIMQQGRSNTARVHPDIPAHQRDKQDLGPGSGLRHEEIGQ